MKAAPRVGGVGIFMPGNADGWLGGRLGTVVFLLVLRRNGSGLWISNRNPFLPKSQPRKQSPLLLSKKEASHTTQPVYR